MPFEIFEGDILEQDVDVIVIPYNPPNTVPETDPISKRVYKAAGVKMKKAREGFRDKELFINDFEVTPGFNLKAGQVYHLRVPKRQIGSPTIFDSEFQFAKTYESVLMRAQWNNVKSIAFTLLGYDITQKKAVDIAEHAIKRYLHDFLMDIDVYVVIPPDFEKIYYNPVEKKAPPPPPSAKLQITDRFIEFERRLKEEQYKSGWKQEYFNQNTVNSILSKYNEKNKNDNSYRARLARTLCCNRTWVDRFLNGATLKPRKFRAVAIAIAMGLEDEERFRLIRCLDFKYPDDECDRIIEELMMNGVRGFDEINDRLIEINEKYSLTRSAKK